MKYQSLDLVSGSQENQSKILSFILVSIPKPSPEVSIRLKLLSSIHKKLCSSFVLKGRLVVLSINDINIVKDIK